MKDLKVGGKYNIQGMADITSRYGTSYKLFIDGGYIILPEKYYNKVTASPTLQEIFHSGKANFVYKGVGTNKSYQLEFGTESE